jgi:hypothetical protein
MKNNAKVAVIAAANKAVFESKSLLPMLKVVSTVKMYGEVIYAECDIGKAYAPVEKDGFRESELAVIIRRYPVMPGKHLFDTLEIKLFHFYYGQCPAQIVQKQYGTYNE